MTWAHEGKGWQRPCRPAVSRAAPDCVVEASHTTFPVVPYTLAFGKCLENEGSSPVIPGNWSVYRGVGVACWNLNYWPGQQGSPWLTPPALTPDTNRAAWSLLEERRQVAVIFHPLLVLLQST